MPFRDFGLTYQSHLSAAMAANSQNYGSLPEIVPTSAPKTSKRRAIASVAVAVMMAQRALRGTSAAGEPEALAPGRAVFRRRRGRDEEDGSHRRSPSAQVTESGYQ